MTRIIAGILQASNIAAEVLAPEAVTSVADYDAVIPGSAVDAGLWLEEESAVAGDARRADGTG